MHDMRDAPRGAGAVVWVLTGVRIGLGCLWIYAGVVKLLDPVEGLLAVRAYDLVPERLVVALGYSLPFLEVMLGALLVLGFAPRLAGWLSALVLLAFIAAIASAWARGLEIECGCFGGGGQTDSTTYGRDILRDALLLGASVLIALGPPTRLALGRLQRRATSSRPLEGWRTVAAALALLAVVTGAGTIVQLVRFGTRDIGADSPQGVVGQFGILRGRVDAPVTVTIYEDFMCGFCRSLEAHVGGLLAEEVGAGNVRVDYRLLAFLNRESNRTRYSQRAANAAACTRDVGGEDAFVALHQALFDHQPSPGTDGLTDEELIDLARAAGAPSAVAGCIEDERFAAWVVAGTADATANGIATVPVVLVDGDKVEFDTHNAVYEVTLRQALDEALGTR